MLLQVSCFVSISAWFTSILFSRWNFWPHFFLFVFLSNHVLFLMGFLSLTHSSSSIFNHPRYPDVSFVEIFTLKSVDAFTIAIGEKWAPWAATGCFFLGAFFIVLLDLLVHRMMGHHTHYIPEIERIGDVRGIGGIEKEKQVKPSSSVGGPLTSTSAPDESYDSNRAANESGIELEEKATDSGVVDRRSMSNKSDDVELSDVVIEAGICDDDDEKDIHGLTAKKKKELNRMSLMTAIAIGIHNFPEGLATFVATVDDPNVGIVIGVAIALHNIPEGVSVSLPVYYATGDKWKAFWWSFWSGVSEPVGALLGWLILRSVFSELVYGILFGVVGGMMVYISIRELLPTARKYDPEDKVVTASLFAGMIVMALSLLTFTL